MNFVQQLNNDDFVGLVSTLLQCEREVYGGLKRTSVIHLMWYLEWKKDDTRSLGRLLPNGYAFTFKPFTEDQLKELKMSGIMIQAYLRATKEMYEELNGYP